MKVKGPVLFAISLGIFFLIMIVCARDLSFNAMFFPVSVGIACLILTIIQIVSDLKGEKKETQVYDIAPDRSTPAKLIYQKAAVLFGWILGLYAGIWLFGFKIGFSVFFLLFLKIDGRCGWGITVVLLVVMLLIVYTFEKVLGVHWPEGLLQNYIPLSI